MRGLLGRQIRAAARRTKAALRPWAQIEYRSDQVVREILEAVDAVVLEQAADELRAVGGRDPGQRAGCVARRRGNPTGGGGTSPLAHSDRLPTPRPEAELHSTASPYGDGAGARAPAIAGRWPYWHARVLRLRPRGGRAGRPRGSTRTVTRCVGTRWPGMGGRGVLRRRVHPSGERGLDRSGPGPQWPGDRPMRARGHRGVVDRGARATMRALWRRRRRLRGKD